VVDCCGLDDELSGSCATELVSLRSGYNGSELKPSDKCMYHRLL
jgi:hypothetical protein